MRILVVKHGALGDVVRTSYFAGALRRKYGEQLNLSWVTAMSALPLLRFNPAIDNVWTDFSACHGMRFDHVYSLDDEVEVIESVMKLDAERITGAIINSSGMRDYTDDAAEWFDMGLLSRLGRHKADEIKKINIRTHGEIFADMFGVAYPQPEFWGTEPYKEEAHLLRGSASLVIGISPYSGPRWPSKELPRQELKKLVSDLLDRDMRGGRDKKIILFGAGTEHVRNIDLIREIGDERVIAPDTDDSLLRMAAIIGGVDYLISSDRLALHFAIAQRVPFLAFFAPTSAAEIDDFGVGVKVRSTAADYCSYRKDADNSSLTAERILKTLVGHRPELFETDTPLYSLLRGAS